MKGKRCSCRFRSLLCALALVLLAGVTKPTGAQNIEDLCIKDYEGEVECLSAILASTDQTEIDTYSDTWEDYFGYLYYGTYEEAYLYDNNSLFDQTWAVDNGQGDSSAYMSDPINLGDTYLLVTDHYLWDEGSCEDPYNDWDECDVIPITTTGVWVVAGAPYITSINPTSAAVGSSVSIDVYGDNLIDPFTYDIDPQMTGTGITFNSAYGYSSPVTVNYSFAQNASTGNQTLTLANRFGTSNGVSFTIYDPTPAISQISPNVWPANQVSTGTISGRYFGNNPSVGISDSSITFSYTPVNDGQINFSASVPERNQGEEVAITVTSNGYNGSGFQIGPGTWSATKGDVDTTPNPTAGTFTVQYSSYIPVDNVYGPNGCSSGVFYVTNMIYMGDAFRNTFRTTESIQVAPGAQTSSGFFQDTGNTRNYGYGSPANGSTLSQADEDGIALDCFLWNNAGKATPNFSYNVSYPNAYQAQVQYSGAAQNPLEFAYAPITWNMTVLIDTTNPQSPTATVTANNTCYPSHQIYVNGKQVYLFTPTSNTTAYISDCLYLGLNPVSNLVVGPIGVPSQ